MILKKGFNCIKRGILCVFKDSPLDLHGYCLYPEFLYGLIDTVYVKVFFMHSAGINAGAEAIGCANDSHHADLGRLYDLFNAVSASQLQPQ